MKILEKVLLGLLISLGIGGIILALGVCAYTMRYFLT